MLCNYHYGNPISSSKKSACHVFVTFSCLFWAKELGSMYFSFMALPESFDSCVYYLISITTTPPTHTQDIRCWGFPDKGMAHKHIQLPNKWIISSGISLSFARAVKNWFSEALKQCVISIFNRYEFQEHNCWYIKEISLHVFSLYQARQD